MGGGDFGTAVDSRRLVEALVPLSRNGGGTDKVIDRERDFGDDE